MRARVGVAVLLAVLAVTLPAVARAGPDSGQLAGGEPSTRVGQVETGAAGWEPSTGPGQVEAGVAGWEPPTGPGQVEAGVAGWEPPTAPGQVEAGVAPGEPPTDPRPGEAFADPTVAKLQRTAADAQQDLGDLSRRIHDAERELHAATTAANTARAARERADQVVAEQQADVDAYSAAVYSSLGQPTELRALMAAADPSSFLDGSGFLDHIRADQANRLAAAVHRQEAAERAEAEAGDRQADAAGRKADLDRRTADASDRAAAVSAELHGIVADTDAAVVAAQRAQRERDRRTAANWQAYLDRLTTAGIEPPPAAALRDPANLPAGLGPVPGVNGPQAGVAKITNLLVLPRETVDAVSAAIGALGKPYVPGRGGTGPAAYSCDGLVRAAFGDAVPNGLGAQYARLAPVPSADAQPGDLVFLGPARYGAQGVGIVLDERTMLTADARRAGVVVADLPGGDTVLGFARPTLAPGRPRAVPKATDGGLAWRCGGVDLPAGAWGGYPNGFIPLTALCPAGVGRHVLRCDAAAAFTRLDQAFRAALGRPLCVTDSYRTFSAQVRLYGVKPALAAIPGTSNHGWGLAVDLCGGIQSFGSSEYSWMLANAPRFGWSNPLWAHRGNGREEPWHWEFSGR
jgi:peptidoglycan DL-endopeptidase CwlO